MAEGVGAASSSDLRTGNIDVEATLTMSSQTVSRPHTADSRALSELTVCFSQARLSQCTIPPSGDRLHLRYEIKSNSVCGLLVGILAA